MSEYAPLTPQEISDLKQAASLGVSFNSAADYALVERKRLAALLKEPALLQQWHKWKADAVVFHAARLRVAKDPKERRFSEDFLRRNDWGET